MFTGRRQLKKRIEETSKCFELPPFASPWLSLGSWAIHCQCDTSLESHSRQFESRYRDLGSLGWNTLVRTCVLYDLSLLRCAVCLGALSGRIFFRRTVLVRSVREDRTHAVYMTSCDEVTQSQFSIEFRRERVPKSYRNSK